MEISNINRVHEKLSQISRYILDSSDFEFIFNFIKNLKPEIIEKITFVEYDDWLSEQQEDCIISIEIENKLNTSILEFNLIGRFYSIYETSGMFDAELYFMRKKYSFDDIDFNYINEFLYSIEK